MSTPLSDIFAAASPHEEAPPASLERELEDAIAGAQEAWPDVDLADGLFVAYLGSRSGDEGGIEGLRIPDLYLACACVMGDPSAIGAFEKTVLARAQSKVQKMVGNADQAGELMQRMRSRLLVGDTDHPPRLVQYTGAGDLVNWTRVVAVREVLMERRKSRPDSGDDEELGQAIAQSGDPELELMRERCKAEFREAFGQALASLTPRERTVLRHHVLDRLSIDRIGAVLGVHRSTAARWLVKIREQLQRETKEALTHKLTVTPTELESLMRLVRSQMDVSMRGLLQSGPSGG